MDLTKEVEEFISANGLRNAKEINEKGHCGEFAKVIWMKYPVEVRIKEPGDPSIEGHFYIVDRDGLYYDSESPKGVAKASDLKYFKRRSKPSKM